MATPDKTFKDFNLQVALWNKVSQSGKPYQQISLQKSEKQQDGSYQNVTIYMFASDAPKAAALLMAMYNESLKTASQQQNNPPPTQSAQPTYAQVKSGETPMSDLDDEIPF